MHIETTNKRTKNTTGQNTSKALHLNYYVQCISHFINSKAFFVCFIFLSLHGEINKIERCQNFFLYLFIGYLFNFDQKLVVMVSGVPLKNSSNYFGNFHFEKAHLILQFPFISSITVNIYSKTIETF